MPRSQTISSLGLDIPSLDQLHDARLSAAIPAFAAARRRYHGAAARGITYEKKVARALGDLFGRANVYVSRWLVYRLQDGRDRFAQPDVFVVTREFVFIFETKLSQCDRAVIQLTELYGPLLTKIFSRPCVLIQVCRSVDSTKNLIKLSDLPSLQPDPDRVHILPLLI